MTGRARTISLMVLAAFAALLTACAGTATPSATVTVTTTTTVTAVPSASARPTADAAPTPAQSGRAASGLPTMSLTELPAEARTVLGQVERGGPFEYSQDGQTFQNRERLLPAQALGFYREYTVETPGSPDRGARRLVIGSDGVVFYTSDHYQSFREVVP